ncbi:hypothetical protein L873DRAFT_1760151 [Choiromyces venosus 120613-1]|uniref:Homoserine dehydrogenase n=1 Tax=Choiromyces venosus 120613-1 TaxID=1336337 RepID=A0A3N4K0A4_9PEZI|nr:hypothetical protein L873DRAFT_1760151 [Choiromyces venosus 120613-1]
MSKIYVAIIGAGGVGKSFISQLNAYVGRIRNKHTINTILISRSSKALQSKDYSGINLTTWESDLSGGGGGKPPAFPEETLKFLTGAPGPVILVDNTSSEEVAGEYPRFLSAGVHVVTPNKKGFSGSLELFQAIYAASAGQNGNGGYVFHEATVGAGLPVLSTLRDLQDTGDEIVKIEGVFSGTMSYLFNSFAPLSPTGSEKPFSACVAQARELGYTEPDPRDDLNGLDVARKLTILARLSGLPVSQLTSFPIQSLIPKPLETAASAEEFLDGLAEFDNDMEGVKAAAEKEGAVVRYVGSLDVAKGEVSVGLRNFDKGSAVAGLKGSDNIISFYTRRYGDRALIVQGAGAGAEVTAMGVLSDFIKVLERLK